MLSEILLYTSLEQEGTSSRKTVHNLVNKSWKLNGRMIGAGRAEIWLRKSQGKRRKEHNI
jgi:hypothetical protein